MMAIRPPQFGRQEYWDEQYKQEKSFSWYTGWADLRPFWEEVSPTLPLLLTYPLTLALPLTPTLTPTLPLTSCARTGRRTCWCRAWATTRPW